MDRSVIVVKITLIGNHQGQEKPYMGETSFLCSFEGPTPTIQWSPPSPRTEILAEPSSSYRLSFHCSSNVVFPKIS